MSQLRAGRTPGGEQVRLPERDRLLGYAPIAAFDVARSTVRGGARHCSDLG